MSISTQLTRMAQNVGARNADTNAIFEALRAKGVPVPANAQLSDVADMIGEIETYVTIGGRQYKTVTIGNQEWLAENLDYKWSGLITGSSSSSTTTPYANYRDNDESTYGWNGLKYGLLYNYPSVSYLISNPSILPSGWRVPSKTDTEKLLDAVGGITTAGLKLKSQTGWLSYQGQDGNGTDNYGFNLKPNGFGRATGTFNVLGWDGYFWTSTETGTTVYTSVFDIYDVVALNNYNKDLKFSIRLVKDVT